MASIWQTLPKPFVVLAPMEDVTDTVFRRIVASCARPDIFFTEFTSAEGLLSRGAQVVADRLVHTKEEHPIIAQIWGHDPAVFYEVAQMLVGMGFDGIDINMGCPVKAVTRHGGGACLIKTPDIAAKIIAQTKRGAGNLAVSVKTRIGYSSIQTDTWISFLLGLGIDALTVHARTASELSKVPAHWEEIQKAVEIRNKLGVDTVIIGNGDVKNKTEAIQKCTQFGADGVMIGRGIFDNLWAFSEKEHVPTTGELLDIMDTHVRLFDQTWGKTKHFEILRKFFKIYIHGFTGASDERVRAMKLTNAVDALAYIRQRKIMLG